MTEKYEFSQVSVRLVKDAPLLSSEAVNSPQAAIRVLSEALSEYDREVIGVVHLDSASKPINMTIVSMGVLNYSVAHPREILKAAFLSNAASIMLFHNHPSGNLEPSKDDIRLTNRMQTVCQLAGVPIVDHIIIGRGNSYYSFREKDILSTEMPRFSGDLEDINLKAAEQEAQDYEHRKPRKLRI